jgi:hypothetical protein
LTAARQSPRAAPPTLPSPSMPRHRGAPRPRGQPLLSDSQTSSVFVAFARTQSHSFYSSRSIDSINTSNMFGLLLECPMCAPKPKARSPMYSRFAAGPCLHGKFHTGAQRARMCDARYPTCMCDPRYPTCSGLPAAQGSDIVSTRTCRAPSTHSVPVQGHAPY